MGMTITEKILGAHAGRPEVHPGEFISAKVDLVMSQDGSTPPGVQVFKEEMGVTRVFDPAKLVVVPDHEVPPRDATGARNLQIMRDFVREQGISNFFEIGRQGISHNLLPEQGFVVPGDLIVGGDSHSVTYGGLGCFSTGIGHTDVAGVWALGEIWLLVPESVKFVYNGQLGPWVGGKDLILFTIGQIGIDGARYKAMEFTGEAISHLPVHGRLTMCNMAIEAGGKNGIVPADEVTFAYLRGRARKPESEWRVYRADPDANYAAVYEWDVSRLRPMVACPHKPENVKPVDEVAGTPINQVFLGSCTNGWLEDLRTAAQILRGKKVHPDVRLIVLPATSQIFLQAAKEGLIEIFAEAGAAVGPATCGPCAGLHLGVVAEGERVVSTTNRNFVGRMGPPGHDIYLAGPAVAAASAVKGRIAAPEEVA